PQRLDDPAAVERGSLHRRGRILWQSSRWRRNRTAQTLERQLAVEEVGVSSGTLEIDARRLKMAAGKGGASRPIIALGLHLQRAAGSRITVEQRERALRVTQSFERNPSAQPCEI